MPKRNYELYCADCLKVMVGIPGNSIDMVLCDLPYGMTNAQWDSIIDIKSLWQQYSRIVKANGCIALFGSEPFASKLRCSNLKLFRFDWVWNKGSSGNPLLAKMHPLKTHETISVFSKKKVNYFPILTDGAPRTNNTQIESSLFKETAKYNRNRGIPLNKRYPLNIIKVSSRGNELASGKRLHPTQKPVELLEYLIKSHTTKNMTVLDNCMGSGSAGVACVNTGRKFIGIEKDISFFEIARQRIELA